MRLTSLVRRQLPFKAGFCSRPLQRTRCPSTTAAVTAAVASAAAAAAATVAAGIVAANHCAPSMCAEGAEDRCSVPDAPTGSSLQWSKVIERVVPAIVSLRVCAPMTFDTEEAGCSVATGFVVDAKRGLILTNRHVVHQGPVTAEAVFQNNEEVPVFQVYSDPIHDFGVFRFDPSAIRHMHIAELELDASAAVVGTEIRVVGNDAAEKLAIASGTLARVDRDAPNYGKGSMNDFNTFYLQASSSTTGGSSGSPVVNCEGTVSGLNAGGKMGTAASYYLPLARVVRALALLRAGEPVPRGFIGCAFVHKPLCEARRLGLRPNTEEAVWQLEASGKSQPGVTAGVLVVKSVIPGSCAHGKLEPGDIVTCVESVAGAGANCERAEFASFVAFEALLDSSVGEPVRVHVERRGEPLVFTCVTEDLHALTPKRCLSIGGSTIQPTSLQLAHSFSVPTGVPCVCEPGYMFEGHMRRNAVIVELDGAPMDSLEDVELFFENLGDKQDVLVKFFHMGTAAVTHQIVVTVPRRAWFGMSKREAACPPPPFHMMGAPWRRTNLGDSPTVDSTGGTVPSAATGSTEAEEQHTAVLLTAGALRGRTPMEQHLAPSLVSVDFKRPYTINGIRSTHYRGTGLVVDAELGLVCVDRNTVPSALGDVNITFANTETLAASVVYVHPFHNFSICKYDPAAVSVVTASAVLAPSGGAVGDDVTLVGLSSRLDSSSSAEIVSRETKIKGIEWQKLGVPHPPRFQQSNLELIRLMDLVKTDGGAVLNADGAVVSIWCSFFFQRQGGGGQESQFVGGMPVAPVAHAVGALRKALAQSGANAQSDASGGVSGVPPLRTLGLDLETISLAQARKRGLDAVHTAAFAGSQQHALLVVNRCWGGSAAMQDHLLENGDVILAVEGVRSVKMMEVEQLTQQAAARTGMARVTVLRKRQVVEALVPMMTLHAAGPEALNEDRLVFFNGLVLQTTPLAISMQRGLPTVGEGVYVSCRYPGSPASVSGPAPTSRILEVNGQPTLDLDAFLAAVQSIEAAKETSCVVKYRDLSGATSVTAMKTEPEHWGLSEIRAQTDGWERVEHKSP